MKISVKEELSRIKRFVSLIVIILFIHFSLLSYGDAEITSEEFRRPLELSLLFPGFGQLKEKNFLKGALFLSGELFSIYKILSYNAKGNSGYIRYKNSVTTEEAVMYRREVEEYDKKRNIFIIAGIGIWALNLLDIYLYEKKKRKLKLSIKNDKNKTVIFGIDYSF